MDQIARGINTSSILQALNETSTKEIRDIKYDRDIETQTSATLGLEVKSSLFSPNPINIAFENLNYQLPAKNKKNPPKIILNNLTGLCENKQLTAILGFSGAGKTSLLNILAKRLEDNKSISGKISANNKTYS